ncbi:MAG: helix-turn-helix transcriptional regulator, partial [Longispora sp.]|nr:helix-turn-helix transcriptional regulator [Longispora sp. (in: high G+C Gram-positive bacteria)]
VLEQLRKLVDSVPGLALTVGWLSGWLAESRRELKVAQEIYEQTLAASPHRDEISLHRARLQHAYGRFLLNSSSRKDAKKLLRVAHHHYADLGAHPYLEACDRDLESAGLQILDEAPNHLLSLTDREREVANLVKRGITNAEMVQELHVSAKTVEHHLSNIYAKYNVHSRQKLRKLLSPLSESTRE